MKVFATLATILGVAHATPNAMVHPMGQMGTMRSSLQEHSNIMPNTGMSVQSYRAKTGPDQYHLQDNFGNFVYAYANQDSEKMEKGNEMSVRGHYVYIMSDGVLRRVEYIADNNGFHVLQDNADNSRAQDRIKRSVEPDMVQTRMTSFMDSTFLRDDSMVNPKMNNAMKDQRMASQMVQRGGMDRMSSDRDIYSMTDMSSKMVGNNMMGRNMYKNDITSNMMNRNIMTQEMSNIRGPNIYSNMIGRDQSSNIMGRDGSSKMIGHDMMGRELPSDLMGKPAVSTNIMTSNVMGKQDMSTNMMTGNMMGRNMYSSIMGSDINSNTLGGELNTYRSDVNRMPLGQRNTPAQHAAAANHFAAKWGKRSADAESKPFYGIGIGNYGLGLGGWGPYDGFAFFGGK